MEIGKWKVKLMERVGYLGHFVYVFRRLEDGRYEYLQVQHNKKRDFPDTIVCTSKDSTDVKPLFFFDDTSELLGAFIEEAQRKGVLAPNERVEGYLEAQGVHLENIKEYLERFLPDSRYYHHEKNHPNCKCNQRNSEGV